MYISHDLIRATLTNTCSMMKKINAQRITETEKSKQIERNKEEK